MTSSASFDEDCDEPMDPRQEVEEWEEQTIGDEVIVDHEDQLLLQDLGFDDAWIRANEYEDLDEER